MLIGKNFNLIDKERIRKSKKPSERQHICNYCKKTYIDTTRFGRVCPKCKRKNIKKVKEKRYYIVKQTRETVKKRKEILEMLKRSMKKDE